MTEVVRVATWNVREGRPSSDPDNRQKFAEDAVHMINTVLPDVLALQEIDLDGKGHSSVLKTLREQTSLRHIHHVELSPSAFQDGQYAGLAIASRCPTDVIRHAVLPNPDLTITTTNGVMRSYDKGFLECTIKIGDRAVSVVSLHAYPFRRFQRDASDAAFAFVWEALGEHLSQSRPDALVVAGDLNSADRRLILDNTAIPLSGAMGGQPTHAGMAADDILYSRDFTVRSARTVSTLSDHALCVAELELD